MARSIKDSLDLLDTSRSDIRSALSEKGVEAAETLKVSEVDDYIKQISTGSSLMIEISGTGYPPETTYTAEHTDGTTVSGTSPLTVTKAGTWTITDSYTQFSDSVTVKDTFPLTHEMPVLTVTTDIGDGNIQTCTLGSTVLKEEVSGGKAVFYLPEYGTWTIGYAQSENEVTVSVQNRQNYTAEYTVEVGETYHITVSNASSVSKFYVSSPGAFSYEFSNSSYKSNFSFDLKITKQEKDNWIKYGRKLWIANKASSVEDGEGMMYYDSYGVEGNTYSSYQDGQTYTFDWSNAGELFANVSR